MSCKRCDFLDDALAIIHPNYMDFGRNCMDCGRTYSVSSGEAASRRAAVARGQRRSLRDVASRRRSLLAGAENNRPVVMQATSPVPAATAATARRRSARARAQGARTVTISNRPVRMMATPPSPPPTRRSGRSRAMMMSATLPSAPVSQLRSDRLLTSRSSRAPFVGDFLDTIYDRLMEDRDSPVTPSSDDENCSMCAFSDHVSLNVRREYLVDSLTCAECGTFRQIFNNGSGSQNGTDPRPRLRGRRVRATSTATASSSNDDVIFVAFVPAREAAGQDGGAAGATSNGSPATAAASAIPRPTAVVSGTARPTASATVTRPTASATVTRPTASATVTRPTAPATVTRPADAFGTAEPRRPTNAFADAAAPRRPSEAFGGAVARRPNDAFFTAEMPRRQNAPPPPAQAFGGAVPRRPLDAFGAYMARIREELGYRGTDRPADGIPVAGGRYANVYYEPGAAPRPAAPPAEVIPPGEDDDVIFLARYPPRSRRHRVDIEPIHFTRVLFQAGVRIGRPPDKDVEPLVHFERY